MTIGTAPFYLSKLLQVYTPSRTLRSSSDARLLTAKRYKRKQNGFRSFTRYMVLTSGMTRHAMSDTVKLSLPLKRS